MYANLLVARKASIYIYIHIEREVYRQGRQSGGEGVATPPEFWKGVEPTLNFGRGVEPTLNFGRGVEPTLIFRKICGLFGVNFLKVGLF